MILRNLLKAAWERDKTPEPQGGKTIPAEKAGAATGKL
jgi:hypothetical protein